jgi:DNA-3-methyladenine glycosylase II
MSFIGSIKFKMSNQATSQLQNADDVLKNIIATIPEPTIVTTNDVFHDLMSCILEQQIHYRSTKRIFQKMLKTANIERLTLDNFAKFEKTAFANSKLAIGKFETVERIVDFFTVNKINWALLSDVEVIEKLSSEN